MLMTPTSAQPIVRDDEFFPIFDYEWNEVVSELEDEVIGETEHSRSPCVPVDIGVCHEKE